MDRALDLNSTKVLRHINALRCLRLLHDGRSMSRAELARELGLTRTTIGYAVTALSAEGYVVEGEIQAGGRVGRPGIGVGLQGTGAYFIGLDIGPRNITGVLIDLRMTVVRRVIEPTGPHYKDPDTIVARLLALVPRLIVEAKIEQSKIIGLCVSIPGLVSRDGSVVNAPFLEWRDYPLRERLVAGCGPDWVVEVRNDAAAFANAEASALHHEAGSVLIILMAEGIGGAVIDAGTQITGANGYAGEIGQMLVTVDGRTDTFQMLAGARSLPRLLRPGRTVADGVEAILADAAKPKVAKAMERWAEALAVGLANAIHLLDPGRIVFGGPLAALFPSVSDQVAVKLAKTLLPGFRPPPMSVARFGADGAAIGAAATLREVIFALPNLGSKNADAS